MRFLKALVLGAAALLSVPAIAQVQVLGFEIGTTTLQQVKDRVSKQTRIEDNSTNKWTGGPQFKTDGSGYGVETLSDVLYIFDKDQKLAAVLLTLDKSRFDSLFNVLAKKYKTTAKQRPYVGNMFARFKGNGSVIELDAPHLSFTMEARYIRDDLNQQFNTQSAAEAQQKKAAESAKF